MFTQNTIIKSFEISTGNYYGVTLYVFHCGPLLHVIVLERHSFTEYARCGLKNFRKNSYIQGVNNMDGITV
jgi:hypothetical protein